MRTEEVNGLLRALHFAAGKHRKQRRKDKRNTPYINHPIDVCYILSETGSVDDPVILKAAALHDTIEDTATRPEEIRELFGTEVLELVLEVTDDKSLPRAVRKNLQIEHAAEISARAKQIKLADKISNIKDILANPPWNWNRKRKIEYLDWAGQVAGGLKGVNRKLDDEFEEVMRSGREQLA